MHQGVAAIPTDPAPPGSPDADGATVPPGGATDPARSRLRRLAPPLVAGLVAAGATAALWAAGLPRGNAALAVAVLLALAVPTSRALSRRALLAGAMLFGFTPILWWAPLPLGTLGRAGLLITLLVGGLAAWLTGGGRRDVARRAHLMLPRFALVDALPVLAAGASAAVVAGWFQVRSAPAALAALFRGYDNSAHFDMVQMLLRHGTTVDRLGTAPHGETWQFAQYPQGYHAVVATLIEATGVPPAGDPAAALVSYLHAEAWVIVLMGGLLAAAVCSLPALRRRPVLALPAAALLVAGFVTGPGGAAFTGGFPNFVLGCALAACVPLLVAMTPRVPMPLQVAGIGALLAGVASSWILLLAIAGPAALVLAFPATRARWRGRRRDWLATAAVLVVTAFAVLAPLRVLGGLNAGNVLVIPGGIAAPDLGFVVAVALAGVALCLWTPTGTLPWRHARHVVTPVAGLLAAAALGLWQLHSAGSLSYYFYKLLIGVELTALAVVVLGFSGHALAFSGRLPRAQSQAPGHEPPPRRMRTTSRVLRLAAVLVATLAASQVTGLTLSARHLFSVPSSPSATATQIVTAATQVVTASRATLLVPDVGPGDTLEAQQWYLALTGRWTSQANDAATQALFRFADEPTKAGLLLDQDPAGVVLVDPATVDAVRRSVGSAERQARVLPW